MKRREILEKIIHVFFPLKCRCCLKDIAFDSKDPFCPSCLKKLEEIKFPYCRLCGMALKAGGKYCFNCLKSGKKNFNFSRSAYMFEPVIREVIHDFKYKGFWKLGEWLGLKMAEKMSFYGEFSSYDSLACIPLSSSKLKERGYNQSEILALKISEEKRIPFIKNALIKNKNTKSQAGLSADERKKNIKGAFLSYSKEVSGKKIILIDDVATTLSTLNEAAFALKLSGADAVSCYTLARE